MNEVNVFLFWYVLTGVICQTLVRIFCGRVKVVDFTPTITTPKHP